MIAFIPAAGLGTRMGELTRDTPKPLLKIGEMSMLDYSIHLAHKWGCRKFFINTHYLAEKIHDDLVRLKHLDINISHEKDEILGTAGGIKTALEGKINIDERILIINPDMLLIQDEDFNPTQVNPDSDCLLYIQEIPSGEKYTPLNFEKGKISFGNGNYYYIGLGILRFSVLENIPVGKYYDLAEIFRKLAKEGNLDGKIFPGEVIDLGDKEKYLNYQKETKKKR